MDIMELGAIGELVGGVAVLVTLIYLALQVRSGNAVSQDNASHAWVQLNFDLAGQVAVDRELAEFWVKGGTQFDQLDSVDQQRIVFYEWRAIEGWHHAFHQWKRGILREPHWNRIVWVMENIGQRQSIREAWRTFRDSYDADFQRFVDGHIGARAAAGDGL
jgi:hypothetical protein